ncbi:MAG: cytochrome c3 family protein [Syntrophorhabdaceae bacterium]|nr:cytochrome c3 family protein [Syntrophorhabdaceae bacterium]
MDKDIVNNDIHFSQGCSICHKGNPTTMEIENAHIGIVKKPSSDLKACSDCHDDIVKKFKDSLHYTATGLLEKTSKRLSEGEKKTFKEKVYPNSCKICHATCGDCHVSSPKINKAESGLIDKHKFIKYIEDKTCGICHFHSVYSEWVGKINGKSDIHREKGMKCVDCHKKDSFHGDGNIYRSKDEVKGRPKCKNCHDIKRKTTPIANLAHTKHEGRLSCYSCHGGTQYNNCFNCHIDKGFYIKKGFYMGINPQDKRTITVLRAIPIHREIFKGYGIKMEGFDREADFREAFVHNIQKTTERTRSCDICHISKKGFLTEKDLKKDGSKANKGLIFKMGPMDIR